MEPPAPPADVGALPAEPPELPAADAVVVPAAPAEPPVVPPLAAAGVVAPEPARGAEVPPELVVVLVVVVLVVVLVGVDELPADVVFDDVGGGAVMPAVPNIGAIPVPVSPPLLPQAETHNRPTNRNRSVIVFIRAPHARARLCHDPLGVTMSVVVCRIHLRRQ